MLILFYWLVLSFCCVNSSNSLTKNFVENNRGNLRLLLINSTLANSSSRLQSRIDKFMGRSLNLLNERHYCGYSNCLKKTIQFKHFKYPGQQGISRTLFANQFREETQVIECDPNEKFAFVLHGWKQSCDTEWVQDLVDQLHLYRGGCIICIDYSLFANWHYLKLKKSFDMIVQGITAKMNDIIDAGFNPKNGYMFGFSFGGQLATAVGKMLGPDRKFKNIDTCDMAGPGFDHLPFTVDHRLAADNVQCFHSSADKGTLHYECHQNVRFGVCGFSQPAVETQKEYGSHGLCTVLYVNSFDYPFYALPHKPYWCNSQNPAIIIPQDYTVGYREKIDVFGEVFVPTGKHFPYNLSKRQLLRLDY